MSGIGLHFQQNQSMRQEQVMAPHQIQALTILLSTIPELEQKIDEELLSNPTLELVDKGTELLSGNVMESSVEEVHAKEELDASAVDRDESLASIVQMGDSWQDYAPSNASNNANSSDAQEKRQYMFDSLVSEPSLQDFLYEQLKDRDELTAAELSICEQIVGSIDPRGYLRTNIADIAIVEQCGLEEVEHCLAVVQSFEPLGIAARDIRECLLIQLVQAGYDKKSKLYKLVDKHLDDIERNRIPNIAKALRASTVDVYELLKQLRNFDPAPGSKMTSRGVVFVAPEIFIEQSNEGEWLVRSNHDYTPRVRLNPRYLEMLEDPTVCKEDKAYIREKIMSSKMLMRAITQRCSTLELVGKSLLKFQIAFFEHGDEELKPLIMNQVAEDIGVHETTISRAISNKYVQTPHGLFPLKHFFTAGYENDNGEMVASQSIKHILQEVIDNEPRKKPYSDKKLTEILGEKGFKVARRTVAKYREELNIPSSGRRKSF